MISGKNKDSWWIVVCVVAFVVVAWVSTCSLPWKPVYEARYEFRVRNFRKNVENCDTVMRNMDVMGSYGLCRYLGTLPVDDGLQRKLRYDNTEKITLCVRGEDSAATASYAAALYAEACDTLQRFGDTLFARVAEVLREYGATETLADVELDLAGEASYMDLLNGAEVPQAHRTPSRAVVLLLAAVGALLFALAVCVLKVRRKNEEGC